GRHAGGPSPCGRRADLRHRRGQRGRVWPRDHRQHELPPERLRAHGDDQERRHGPGGGMGPHRTGLRRALMMSRLASLLVLSLALAGAPPAGAAPEGQMTWATHISLAPTWFDPAETPGIATPFLVLHALHHGLVKPLPDNPAAPSLAESWSASPDGLAYEFVLRKAARFNNGDPMTARAGELRLSNAQC